MFIKDVNTCTFFFVPSVYTLNFTPCTSQSLGIGLLVTVFLIESIPVNLNVCQHMSSFFLPAIYTLNFSPCSFQSLGFGLVVTVFLIKWQCLLRYICEYLSPLLCSFYIYSKLLSLFLPVSGLWSSGHCISYREVMFIRIYVIDILYNT